MTNGSQVVKAALIISAVGCAIWGMSVVLKKHAAVGKKTTSQSKSLPRAVETWGAVTNGFRLKLEVAQQTIRQGDPVLVTLTLQNVSKENRRVMRASPFSDYWFRIKDPNGKQSCVGGDFSWFNTTRWLTPNQTLVDKVDLSSRYKFSSTGKYHIAASRSIPNVSRNGFSSANSNTVELTVLESPKKAARSGK